MQTLEALDTGPCAFHGRLKIPMHGFAKLDRGVDIVAAALGRTVPPSAASVSVDQGHQCGTSTPNGQPRSAILTRCLCYCSRITMLTGPFYYRTLFGHAPITRQMTYEIVEYVLRVVAYPKKHKQRTRKRQTRSTR